ncbi:YqkE family protein [Cytobacillus sp. FJAT-54145]|uniref:YqkE family protein n=1 Tax=Cytobacillus spartinae TaxID=3299023 RepID=A0ABW6KIA5_9BACI
MKKRPQRQVAKNEDKPVTLGDLMNKDIMEQLKEKKQQLKAEEERLKEEEEARKREERRLKEKNKSFEELLQDSSLNWKEFK